MNDAPQTPGGSRWEPPKDDHDAAGYPDPPAQPTAWPSSAPASYAPARPQGRWSGRGGLLVAGGALGLALALGAGGYAIGHTTGGDQDETGQVGQLGDDGPGDVVRDGDGRVGPGFAPPGQIQPDQTQPRTDPGSEDDAGGSRT